MVCLKKFAHPSFSNGDVEKFGDVILYMVNNVTTLPLRIPLGSISSSMIEKKLVEQLDDVKKLKELSASTDLPASVTAASAARSA